MTQISIAYKFCVGLCLPDWSSLTCTPKRIFSFIDWTKEGSINQQGWFQITQNLEQSCDGNPVRCLSSLQYHFNRWNKKQMNHSLCITCFTNCKKQLFIFHLTQVLSVTELHKNTNAFKDGEWTQIFLFLQTNVIASLSLKFLISWHSDSTPCAIWYSLTFSERCTCCQGAALHFCTVCANPNPWKSDTSQTGPVWGQMLFLFLFITFFTRT